MAETREYQELKEALRKPPTEEARKEAAEAMRRYLATHPPKRSRPMLVSLGLRKTYPHAIELKDIPKELDRNPEFFLLMKRIIAKEKS